MLLEIKTTKMDSEMEMGTRVSITPVMMQTMDKIKWGHSAKLQMLLGAMWAMLWALIQEALMK
jgi:hypothetical protein